MRISIAAGYLIAFCAGLLLFVVVAVALGLASGVVVL